MSDSRERYVYGIARRGSVPQLDDMDAVGGGQGIRVVDANGLAAIVSDIETERFKPKKGDLLAHSRVLETVARSCDVLPMRFGTIVPDDQAVVRRLLEASGARLRGILDALSGCVEIQVKATYDEQRILTELCSRDPVVARLRTQPRQSYDDKIKLGERIAQAIARNARSDEGEILARLGPLARDHRPGPPTSEVSVTNTAFLVQRASIDRFLDEVAVIGDVAPDLISVRWVGPLPPYSFVDTSVLEVA